VGRKGSASGREVHADSEAREAGGENSVVNSAARDTGCVGRAARLKDGDGDLEPAMRFT